MRGEIGVAMDSKVVLRSLFVNPADGDKDKLIADNLAHYQQVGGLEWSQEVDRTLVDFILGFHAEHGHPPTGATIRSHFEARHEDDAVDRFERVLMLQAQTRGDFVSLLSAQTSHATVDRVLATIRGVSGDLQRDPQGTARRLAGELALIGSPASSDAGDQAPELDWTAVPQVLADLAHAHAQGVSVDPEMYVLPGLTALSVAAHRSNRIRWSQYHTEPVAIWTLVVADVGTGKSPVFGVLGAPLRDWSVDHMSAFYDQMAEYDQRVADLEATIKDKTANHDDKVAARSELSALIPPPNPQLTVTDATPEAVEVFAGEHYGNYAFWSDEGALLKTFLGAQYSKSPKMSFALTSYSGDAYSADRVGRKTRPMPRTSGVVAAAIQPGAWSRLVSVDGFVDEGPLGRFFVYVASNRAGQRVHCEAPDCSTQINQWHTTIRQLLDAGQRHLDVTDWTPEYLDVDPAVVRVINDERNRLEPLLAPGQPYAHIVGWVNKLKSHIIRIAALHALCDGRRVITVQDAEKAIRLIPWLLHHVTGGQQVAEDSAVSAESSQVERWVAQRRDKQKHSFTRRDLFVSARKWRWCRTVDDLVAPLADLVARGLLTEYQAGKSIGYYIRDLVQPPVPHLSVVPDPIPDTDPPPLTDPIPDTDPPPLTEKMKAGISRLPLDLLRQEIAYAHAHPNWLHPTVVDYIAQHVASLEAHLG
jgi:hypothetical protein